MLIGTKLDYSSAHLVDECLTPHEAYARREMAGCAVLRKVDSSRNRTVPVKHKVLGGLYDAKGGQIQHKHERKQKADEIHQHRWEVQQRRDDFKQHFCSIIPRPHRTGNPKPKPREADCLALVCKELKLVAVV